MFGIFYLKRCNKKKESSVHHMVENCVLLCLSNDNFSPSDVKAEGYSLVGR